ncbi:MAG: DEAD/DEAH box helicase [Planctomyces sp.]|nr:DEAD/DEAH box helicase [Planctomyces sp.]
MVDFEKLRTKKKKTKAIDPIEIFRRLPKPLGINDLYTSQAEVLKGWFERREDRDIVLKLHTGGGKTMVGLLMAQSTLNETGEPVLYLAPTIQLVNQTLEKAKALGIAAVPYEKGQDLDEDFVNGNAIMVATYNALFNGKSKFRLRGAGHPQSVSAVILDDAHVSFSVVRDSFTLQVSSTESRERYNSLTSLFRRAFKEADRLGTFDDVVGGGEYAVLEVPYWAWHEQIDAVREQLRSDADKYPFEWPVLRDELHLCHALISRDAFSITPIVPLVNAFPTFAEATRRIYMSATIADDSDIIRTFDADPDSVRRPLSSRSLAGISERMLLIPDLMPFDFDTHEAIGRIAKWTAEQRKGAVILVPSDKAATHWNDIATSALGSRQVEEIVHHLQAGSTYGPVVFANRYDGMDLPGDSCRLLVLSGLPTGTSTYELFRAAALYGGTTISRMLAQRIEQGIGRGARGSGDHCVVMLVGADLAGWIAKDANFQLLTSATRAQMEMGIEISKEVQDLKDLATTINRSFKRDTDWTEYHAETLAELVDDDESTAVHFAHVTAERKALNLWQDGHPDKAVAKIEKVLQESVDLDRQTRGWMEQLAARIADHWGQRELAERLQQDAYAHNRNLIRPKVRPPYRPLAVPDKQSLAIVRQIKAYHIRRGFLKTFDDTIAYLHDKASSNQFEKALADLGAMIGLSTERHDVNGEGPDVLWLLPHNVGLVIEAKSRKKAKNALTKEEHGQLLVAAEWFAKNYPSFTCERISVHPKNQATRAAVAGASRALTYEKLSALIADARTLLTRLCESQMSERELTAECSHILETSNINAKKIVDCYFQPFRDE